LKVGIVGVGKLGLSLLTGWSRAKQRDFELLAYDKSEKALERARALGAKACAGAGELADEADVVVLAVRPGDVAKALEELRPSLGGGKVLVSTAAFVSVGMIEEALDGAGARVLRAMPNVAASVNSSFTALAPPERRDSSVEGLFALLGEVEWVEEEVLDALTLFSASAPAVVAELLDAFVLASLKAGVPLETARRAVSSVFRGVGELAREREAAEVRNAVATPRGTTVAMLEKLYALEVKSRLLLSLTESYEEFAERLRQFREKRPLG